MRFCSPPGEIPTGSKAAADQRRDEADAGRGTNRQSVLLFFNDVRAALLRIFQSFVTMALMSRPRFLPVTAAIAKISSKGAGVMQSGKFLLVKHERPSTRMPI